MENLYYFETFLHNFEMNAKIIFEEPNCSKNLTIASRTDIAITNSSSSFQNTITNCIFTKLRKATLLPKFFTKRGLFI